MTRPIGESAAARALREEPVPWDPARTEQRLLEVEELAVSGNVFRARVRRVALAVSACAALALGGVTVVRVMSRDAGGPGNLRTSAPVTSVVERDLELTRFADGSTARTAEPGGHLSVQKTTEHEVELALVAGNADFEVAPNPARSFVVLAGGVSVRVVGTRFRVERAGERVRVAVSRGKVEVRWPEGSSFLSAGESRWFPPENPAATPPGTLSAPAPAASAEPSPESVPQTRAARGQFLAQARQGAYAAAYALLAENPSVVGNSAEELMLAADAARLSGHPEQARAYLQRLLQQNSKDSRAPLAAFTLGRILLSQLGRPAEAADAFALARRLSPSGALDEDALLREAEAAFKAGNRARGQALLEEHRAAYPSGRSAATLEKGSGTGQP